MRRRFLVKRFVLLVVALAAVGVAWFSWHRHKVYANAAGLMQSARDAEAAKDKRLAIDYLHRFLGFRPNDKAALFLYGNLLADKDIAVSPAARSRAIRVLEHALRVDGSRDAERRLLVSLMLDPSIGQYQEALSQLKPMLKSTPDDPALNEQMGQCEQKLGKPAAARIYYDKAIKSSQASVETYARLAGILRSSPAEVRDALTKHAAEEAAKKGGPKPPAPPPPETPEALSKEADRLIEAMVKAHAETPLAYLAKATYLRLYPTGGTPAEVLDQIRKCVTKASQLAPTDPDVLLALADLAKLDRNPDAARTLLRGGCMKHPTNWTLYAALADLERQDRNLDAAVAVLKDGLNKVPEQPDLMWALADIYVGRNKKDEANELIVRLRRAGMPAVEVDILRARLCINDRQWKDARDLLEPSFAGIVGRTDRAAKNDFLNGLALEAGLLLGECHMRTGNYDRAQDAFSRVISLNPRAGLAYLSLAEARRRMGQVTQAIAAYEDLIKQNLAPSYVLGEYARLVFLKNRDLPAPDWAEVERAVRLAEQQPTLPAQVLLLRVELFRQQNRLGEAKDYLARLVVPPARVFFPAPRLEQVVQALVQQQEKVPPIFYLARAGVATLEGKFDEAGDWLDRCEKEYSDPSYVRLARIGLCRALHENKTRGDQPMAVAGLKAVEGGLGKYKPEERHQILSALAECYRGLRDTPEETRLWTAIAKEWPDDLQSRIILFDLAYAANDGPRMEALEQQLEDVEGKNGSLWRYAKVRRWLKTAAAEKDRAKQDDAIAKAREMLTALTARRAAWGRIPVAEAQLAELLEDRKPAGQRTYQKALGHYLDAIAKGERTVPVVRRAIELLVLERRGREAYDLLKRLPADAVTGDLRTLAARLAAENNDPAMALQQADALAKHPDTAKDPRQLLALGVTYWRCGELDKAEGCLRKAVDAKDAPPEAWAALITLQAQRRRPDAHTFLAQAEKTLGGNPNALLSLGQCYEAVERGNEEEKKKGRAAKAFQAALRQKPGDVPTQAAVAAYYLRDGKPDQARPLLAQLSVQQQDARSRDWAKSSLVLMQAGKATHADAVNALKSLGRADGLPANADDQSVASQRARIAYQARLRGRANREAAIKGLEDFQAKKLATLTDDFLLAQLYDKHESGPRARQLYRKIAEQKGVQPEMLAAVAQSFLRHGDLADADAVIKRLEAEAPNSVLALEFRGRLLHKQGNTREALATLEKLVDTWANHALLAKLLEDFGYADRAEQLLVKYVAAGPEPRRKLALAEFYGRQKRGLKALELCEAAWATCAAEHVADTVLQIATEASDEPAVLARAEAQLRKAQAANPKAAVLKTALGNLHAYQNRPAEAERLFREAVALDAKDLLAVNNLAWLLSFQRGRAREADDLLKQAVTRHGPLPWLIDTQAVVKLALGQPDEAVKLLLEAVAEEPTPVSYFHLAQAYQQASNGVMAANALAQAKNLGLKPTSVHPLERPAYDRMVQDLASRGAP